MLCRNSNVLTPCNLTQAHAASRPGAVSLYYAAPSALSAAYIQEWDDWRESGVCWL